MMPATTCEVVSRGIPPIQQRKSQLTAAEASCATRRMIEKIREKIGILNKSPYFNAAN